MPGTVGRVIQNDSDSGWERFRIRIRKIYWDVHQVFPSTVSKDFHSLLPNYNNCFVVTRPITVLKKCKKRDLFMAGILRRN